MNEHDATEIAYRNGYEAGKRDAVKHGRWIKKYDYCDDEYWGCSACNEDFYFEFPPIKGTVKYCSECGAKMDLEADESECT